MGESRRIFATLMTVVIAFAVQDITNARAQGRTAEAEVMFDQGKHLMAAGEYEQACLKFEGSQQLSARASTLMNLAACREAQKKLVSAWYTFVEAAKLAEVSTDPREHALAEPSRAKAKALEERRSTLEIVVAPEARVPGLVISRDGAIVVEGQWNSKVPIDGGEYTIVARGRDTDAWTTTIAVASERDAKQVEIPALKPATALPPPPPPPPQTEEEEDDDAPPPPPPSAWTPMRKAAVGVAAAGVVAIAGGAVFGAKGSSKQSAADALCPGTECTDPEAVQLNHDARSAATKANILFVGGGLAVAGGVALWFLGAPKPVTDGDVAIRAHVGTDVVGISFSGGF